MSTCKHHSIIIIGAGLTGLYLTRLLQNHDVVVLEARDRVGGRILSSGLNTQDSACVDLGPAWIWPQLQPRLHQLISDLGLGVFKQYTDGDMLFERDVSKVERYAGSSSHSQSYRILGGVGALVELLYSSVPQHFFCLNTQVLSIDQSSLTVKAMRNEEVQMYSANKIILALPPRLISNMISFTPELDSRLLRQWENTSTWMATHCKIIFIYSTPFWRNQNLSGEVFSHSGAVI